MPRHASRLLVPTFALVAFLFLSPTLATAFPQGAPPHSAAERTETMSSVFSRLWNLLSSVWANGSGLEPNGTNAAPGAEPESGDTGDNGPGLDPNG